MNSEHFRSDRIIFKFLTVLILKNIKTPVITGEHVKFWGTSRAQRTFWGTSRVHGGHGASLAPARIKFEFWI